MPKQGVVEVSGLPAAPLAASAHFLAQFVPQIRGLMRTGDVVAVLPYADHSHASWRLAAIQELAREAAPFRVNCVEGDDQHAVSEVLGYLQSAPGVTGQILTVDAKQEKRG